MAGWCMAGWGWAGRLGADDMTPAILDFSRDTGKRARTKAANRQSILDAARAVFAELGYEATTVRDIIRRTGLASGTFYNYFKSKEEVFHALHDDGVQRFRPLLRHAYDTAATFEDFVRTAYRAFFRFMIEEAPLSRVRVASPDMTFVRFDTPENLALFKELEADIARAIAMGHIPPVDPEYFAAAAYGIAQQMADRLLARDRADPEGAANFATALLLGGLSRLQRE